MAFAGKRKKHPLIRELALPAASFAVVAGLVIYGVNSMGAKADDELYSMVRQSVTRAAVQCYALEGAYPPDIDYLIENYGLAVDETKYLIHYQSNGGNLLPQINVFPAKGQD